MHGSMRDSHAVLIEDCAAAAYTAEATGRVQLVAIPRRACCDVFQ